MVSEPDEVKPHSLSKRESDSAAEPSSGDTEALTEHPPASGLASTPQPDLDSAGASPTPGAVESSPAYGGSEVAMENSCLREDAVSSEEQGGSAGTGADGGASRTGDRGPEGGVEETGGEEEDEEGGGPVKTFLEHLEDLRWTIIRCLAALGIAMVVCLIAGNMVVELLKEPLMQAQRMVKRKSQAFALVQFGTNKWVVDLETNAFGALQLGTNTGIKLLVAPAQIGTNVVLTVVPAPLDQQELPPVNQIELKNLGPVSPFVVALKIALFGGLGLASPFILLFIGQFVVPALKRKEKKYLYQALAIGTALFCAGVLFCYFFMLQIALNAAVQFSKWMGFGADIWRAEDYIGFVVKFLLGMGLSFELPVVLLTLVKLELLDYQRMNKFRPYWVVVNLVIAAILTPPDVVSQMLMAIPLQLLYELSVLIAWYWHWRDRKRQALAGTA